jgi:phytoene dehydrogenase-like protein
MAQMCSGGSIMLARALAADIREHGGEIVTGTEPKAILIHQKKAVGVQLASGERIMARSFVVSGLNPQQTFIKLIDEDSAPRQVRKQAAGFQYNLLAPLFSLNLALNEPPHYKAAERRPELNQAFMVILGLERFAQFSEIVAAHEEGQIPPTVMWGACPTLFDPSQAPADKHTAFMWEKLPYALHGNAQNWDAARDRHGEAMLRLWAKFAPNLRGKAVIDSFSRSPLDTERSLPNMQAGDLLVGSFANQQVGYNRPFLGAGQYRAPIGNLYMCGGSTHPGGNITGLCGYNAARIVAADLKLPIWWNPPQVEEALRAL